MKCAAEAAHNSADAQASHISPSAGSSDIMPYSYKRAAKQRRKERRLSLEAGYHQGGNGRGLIYVDRKGARASRRSRSKSGPAYNVGGNPIFNTKRTVKPGLQGTERGRRLGGINKGSGLGLFRTGPR